MAVNGMGVAYALPLSTAGSFLPARDVAVDWWQQASRRLSMSPDAVTLSVWAIGRQAVQEQEILV